MFLFCWAVVCGIPKGPANGVGILTGGTDRTLYIIVVCTVERNQETVAILAWLHGAQA